MPKSEVIFERTLKRAPFEGFTLTWEHRMFAENRAEKHNLGACFYGSKGTLHLGWKDGWTFYPFSLNIDGCKASRPM